MPAMLRYGDINWHKLKKETQKAGLGVKHVFAFEFGAVNAYHIDAWKAAYPEFKYDERCYLLYIIKDGVRSLSPMSFRFTSAEDAYESVRRMKEINTHMDFELTAGKGQTNILSAIQTPALSRRRKTALLPVPSYAAMTGGAASFTILA